MSFVLPALPALRRARPELTLHLYFGSSMDLLIRVRSQEIDCAIGSMRVADPRLDTLRLHREGYLFVAQPALLGRRPLVDGTDARQHTLIDTHPELPLFDYFRQAPRGGERLRFLRVLRMGTIAAIRELVLAGEGVAVLPAYLVAADLRAGRLRRVFPGVALRSDYFRLIFRTDDPRRAVYQLLAAALRRRPLA
jgi:DNA-binding transcriptional LysR family regulator